MSLESWSSPLKVDIKPHAIERGYPKLFFFIVNVSWNEDKKWEVKRTYEEFLALRTSMPMSACLHMKIRFPTPRPYFRLSDSFLEYRRTRLLSWLSETVADRVLLSNPLINDSIARFLDAEKYDSDFSSLYEAGSAEISEDKFLVGLQQLGLLPDDAGASVIDRGQYWKQSLYLKKWRCRDYILWSDGTLSEYEPKSEVIKNWVNVSVCDVNDGPKMNTVKAFGRANFTNVREAVAVKLRSITDRRTLDLVFESAGTLLKFLSGLGRICKNVESNNLQNFAGTVQQLLNDDEAPAVFTRTFGSSIPVPPMSIVLMVVGTRGDVQPFIYFGQALQRYGHRVRIATHADYRDDVVTKGGLEFYPLAGDPVKLSSYMVKSNGRVFPATQQELREVPEKLEMCRDICHSTFPACTASDPLDPLDKPFTADAIISNPVTYGHIHVAEALSIPLHIFFPQPWYPTESFPHPLANMPFDRAQPSYNHSSYLVMEKLMWLSLRGEINYFRRHILGLRGLRSGEAGGALLRTNAVPISHMWSPSFVPKCLDWPEHVDVVGEFRLMDDQVKPYTPTETLATFLAAGEAPIYIGFGSMVIENSTFLVEIVLKAAEDSNSRVILQSGWTKYAEDNTMLSERVIVVGAMPHDWLFRQVSGVVHHGGAGTTSAGLRAGKPTFICPFFGDQHMWAEMVFRAGVGPAGCRVEALTADIMTDAFLLMKAPETLAAAQSLGAKMSTENGVEQGMQSFHEQLPIAAMLCDVSIFNDKKSALAHWYCVDCGLKMCEEVDEILHRPEGGRIGHHRVLYRPSQWGVAAPETALQGLYQGAGFQLHEAVAGVYDFFRKPIEGARAEGAVGAVKGVGKGIANVIWRPIYGGAVMVSRVVEGTTARTKQIPKQLQAQVRLSVAFDTGRSSLMGDGGVMSYVDKVYSYVEGGRPSHRPPSMRLSDAAAKGCDMAPEVIAVENAFRRAVDFMAIWCVLDPDGDRCVPQADLADALNQTVADEVLANVDGGSSGFLTFSDLAWKFATVDKDSSALSLMRKVQEITEAASLKEGRAGVPPHGHESDEDDFDDDDEDDDEDVDESFGMGGDSFCDGEQTRHSTTVLRDYLPSEETLPPPIPESSEEMNKICQNSSTSPN